jgi:hypothetical protein
MPDDAARAAKLTRAQVAAALRRRLLRADTLAA